LALKLNKTVLVSILVLTGLIEVPVNRWTKRAACTVDGQQRLILFTYLAFFNKGAEAANAVSRSLLDGCRRQSTGAWYAGHARIVDLKAAKALGLTVPVGYPLGTEKAL